MCDICTDLAALLESREYFCREIRIHSNPRIIQFVGNTGFLHCHHGHRGSLFNVSPSL